MFSVVIPLYNKELSIQATITSVLKQTYRNFELVIVNDGSTDNSALKVQEIKDSRVRLVNKANGGVSSARNLGISESISEWVALLDGDDLWDSDYLMKVWHVIDTNSNVNVIASGFSTKSKENAKILNTYLPGFTGILTDYFEMVNKKGRNIFHTSAICAKKSAFISAGFFRENLTHGEDLDMWERLSRQNKIWMINEPLVYYIQDSENRAMNKLPKIQKTRVYNIDKSSINGEEETIYYTKSILDYFYKSIRRGNLERAMLLYKRHRGFISLKSLWFYLLDKVKTIK